MMHVYTLVALSKLMDWGVARRNELGVPKQHACSASATSEKHTVLGFWSMYLVSFAALC